MLNLAREAMAAKGKKKKVQIDTSQDEAVNFAGELNEPRWSIVSFEKCVAKNLTYPQAEKKMMKLAAEKVAGLCIVSDEAAARISKRISHEQTRKNTK
jgi:hypothetical protein